MLLSGIFDLLASFSYWEKTGEPIFTNRVLELMKKHQIDKDTILWVFNYPDNKEMIDSSVGEYSYSHTKKWNNEIIGVYCVFRDLDKKWLLTACWRYPLGNRY